jgi:hypothetical protein
MQLRERFISKWHMDQSVKERLDQGVTKEVWTPEEVLDENAVCHGFCSTYIGSTLPRKPMKGLETSKQEDK